jgi:competence ComEA-like helix-hairpin-helix protein
MTPKDIPVLNPNTADDKDLQQLPGVGPQLASRIVDGRPYQNVEELREVPGLGESVLEDIKSFLTFEAQTSDSAEDRESEAKGNTIAEPSPKPDPAEAEEVKYPLVLTEPKSDRSGILALLAVGAASVLCSVTLTLSVLAGINGTLDFGRHAALQETRTELIQIRSQFEATQVELDALRGRAEALEGVSGKMVEVEAQVAALQQQISGTIEAVDEMQIELSTALEETRAQAERVDRFQEFLDGLSRLIGQVVTEP